MTFQDIFTSDFLERMTTTSVIDAALALGLALVLGLFIYVIYRRTYSGVMYSASFGASLILMTLITTLVILAVSTNVILSLGMVGALSIVRFRTPVKEAMDIVFLFRAIPFCFSVLKLVRYWKQAYAFLLQLLHYRNVKPRYKDLQGFFL